MKQNSGRTIAMAAAFSTVLLTGATSAQPNAANGPRIAPQGVPQDWSHHSVVYAHPDTPEEAARKGRTAQWRHDYQDPRFVVALTRKLQAQAEAQDFASQLADRKKSNNRTPKPRPQVESGIHRDWSNVMGGGTDGLGGKGTDGIYPAKYSFSLTAAPDCANDFVVYPTATAGATDSAGTLETLPVTITGVPTGTITIGTAGTARTIVLTASAGSNTGQNFLNTGGTTAVATALKDAVNRWSNTTGILATSATNVVTLKHNMSGNTVTIPITNSLTNATTGAAGNGSGTAGQPTIIAFNQLYNTTCTGQTIAGTPNVYWSYNTGTGSTVKTSPVISYYDGGKQVAFVQSNGGAASLVLLKWSNTVSVGTAGAPTALTTQASGAAYRACTAPCMLTIPLNGGADDSFSSPYVDYFGDVIWVGDDNGKLHKITGVFAGTPAEVVGGGFPALAGDGAHETWVGTFSGGGPGLPNGQTVTVNGQGLTTNTAITPFPDFRVNQGATNGAKQQFDATNLAADANNYSISTGISAVAIGSTVTFTNNVSGNVADNTVVEAVNNFAIVDTQQGTANNALSSPVYDGSTDMVFVGSASGSAAVSGGMLHKVNASTGAVISSAKLAANSSTGVRTSPILDSSAGRIYTFVFDDGSGGGTNCNAGGPCAAVTQFDTAFTAGNAGSKVFVGRGNGTAAVLYMGTFDDAYYSSPTPDGNLYVCATDPNNTLISTLWKIPIVNNVMGTAVQGAAVSVTGTVGDCSPISEVKNGGHDYLYMSITDHASDGTATVCGTGAAADACLYMYDLTDLNGTAAGTGAAWGTTNVPFAGLSAVGGTGGIVIDNVRGETGASQVYFSNLTAPGNAYQASQAGLQ